MSYRIEIQPSGQQFVCEPAESVLEAALRDGLAFPYSCRNGTCGTCKGKLLRGSVTYPHGPPPALEPDEHAAGHALLCQARPQTDLTVEMEEIAAVKGLMVKKTPVRVARKEALNHDVMRVDLKLPVSDTFPYVAGQYLDVLLKDGRRRSFSMANPPDSGHLELHIRHVPGGHFTDFVFNKLRAKDLLRVELPLGTFFLRDDTERPAILVGGGTGFAPLKGILENAFAEGVQRPLHLFWGVRAKRDLYLPELPEQWQQQHAQFSYTPALSDPDPTDDWNGETGYIHEVVARHYSDLSAYDVYMSGPPPMIDAAKARFAELGLDPQRLFYDSFDYAADERLA